VDAVNGRGGAEERSPLSPSSPPSFAAHFSYFTLSHSSCIPRRAAPCAHIPGDEDERKKEPMTVLLMVAATALLSFCGQGAWVREGGREGGVSDEACRHF
jgi:hypothetical protein